VSSSTRQQEDTADRIRDCPETEREVAEKKTLDGPAILFRVSREMAQARHT
jgi:hypothetical protein